MVNLALRAKTRASGSKLLATTTLMVAAFTRNPENGGTPAKLTSKATKESLGTGPSRCRLVASLGELARVPARIIIIGVRIAIYVRR